MRKVHADNQRESPQESVKNPFHHDFTNYKYTDSQRILNKIVKYASNVPALRQNGPTGPGRRKPTHAKRVADGSGMETGPGTS